VEFLFSAGRIPRGKISGEENQLQELNL